MPLLPREDSREPTTHSNSDGEVGTRVFRVTSRQIDQQTILVIAHTPEEAASGKANMISSLGRESIREVVECIEYMPQAVAWRSLPESK